MSPISKVNIEDIFGNIEFKDVSIDPKIQESCILECYKYNTGKYPPWNKQEGGRKCDWEPCIKKINLALKEGKLIEYDPSFDYDIIMKLYHWKYNKIPISTSS